VLQQRLNRKTVNAKLLTEFPAHLRAYDLLYEGDTDLRELPFAERRARLEKLLGKLDHDRIDISPLVPFDTWDQLTAARADPASAGAGDDAEAVEGVMIKRRDAPYMPVWAVGTSGADELVPVGKAYFGFTDEELGQIDKFVRANTVNRFGPVREVTHEPGKGLVLEVAFEGLQRSTRHKSGVAMRFPRISRLRWDKPPREADRLETLEKMLA
jgi:DNA ligase-1